MKAKHAHAEPKRVRSSSRTLKLLLGAGAVVAAAVAFIAAGSSQGTFALWNDSADIPEASITVGASREGLSIAAGTQPGPKDQSAVSFPASTWANMLPGDVVRTPITVTNLDSVPYELGAALDEASASNRDVTFALSEGSCVAGPLSGNKLSVAPTMLNSPIIGAKSSRILCLQVELSSSLPNAKQGTTVVPSFTMTVHGYDD